MKSRMEGDNSMLFRKAAEAFPWLGMLSKKGKRKETSSMPISKCLLENGGRNSGRMKQAGLHKNLRAMNFS